MYEAWATSGYHRVGMSIKPAIDFVQRVYLDLRLSRGWSEPQPTPIRALQTTALCGGAPGEAPQLVVPVSTQQMLCVEELEAVWHEAAAAGMETPVLAIQDDTSLLVFLELSVPSMDAPTKLADERPSELAAPGGSLGATS